MRALVSKYFAHLVICGFVLNIGASAYAIYAAKSNGRIYTIGVNRLTDSFTKGLNNTNLSSEQQSAMVINFAKGLDKSLLEFKAGGKVLMMEEAVLSGSIDITEKVVAKIKKGMGNNAS